MNTPVTPSVALHPIALPDGRGNLTVYAPHGCPVGVAKAGELGTRLTLPPDVWRQLFSGLLVARPGEPSSN